jgi:hypothetical protein
MAASVRVEDFEAFRSFRVALMKFAQHSEQALTSADAEVARARSWLESEQASFWAGQLRKRTEAVAKAKDAVRQKKLYKDATGRTPGAIEEEKYLARCVAAVAQAQEKIEAVKKAIPKLEKESELYRGGVSRLGGTVSVDVPRAVALLDRLLSSLEEYATVGVGSGGGGGEGSTTPDVESMARGEAAEAAPAEEAEPTAKPTVKPTIEDQAEKKEGDDVADGK